MDKLKLIPGNRDAAEQELAEAVFTPWDEERLAAATARLMPKGELRLVSSTSPPEDGPEFPGPSGEGQT